MKRFKLVSLVLVVVMAVALLASCSTAASATESSASASVAEATGEASAAATQATEAAAASDAAGKTGKVGVLLPTANNVRWSYDEAAMKAAAEELGYEIEVQYANDDVATQVSQMENMITKGDNVIIICPCDASSMGPTCDAAVAAGIGVISYDRLIMDTKSVTYYVTFDNTKVGQLCGQYIVDELGLAGGAAGPFNVELFTGDIKDNNAKMTLDGAMSVLQPYIDKGQLAIPSGQTSLEQCQTTGWDSGNAQSRMENLLSGYYSNKKLDAIMSTYGGMSLGCISALKSAGYTAENMPIITAQDAEVPSMKSIAAGELSMSIFKDNREEAKVAMDMAKAFINGETYPTSAEGSYNNGAFVVPSVLVDINVFTKDTMDKVVIDTGMFIREEIYGDAAATQAQ